MKKSLFKPAIAAASLRLLLSASALCLLSACVSFQDIQSQAQLKALAPQAGVFPDQGGNAAWPDLQWATSIGGAELQALVNRALENHPSLQAAAARLQAAQAATAAVEANKLPSYELDFWGKHSAEMRGALSQEKVTEAEAQSVRLMLSNAIARAWLQLARQNAQLELSKQQLAVREQFDRLTQQRVSAGLDTKVEVQQNLVQLSGLKNELAQWQEAMALTRNQIAALQGLGPEEGKLIATPKFQPVADTALPGNLPLELLGRRPDIVSARWRVEAGQSDVDVAKTQFYPNINIVGFVGLSSLGLSNLANSGSSIIGAGPAIRLPIFEGGRLRAQLKGKVAAYDVAVATYNQSLTDALREVADQVQILQASQSQLIEQQAAEQAARIGLQLAQQRQKAGTANKLPVLAAESVVLSQQKLSLELAVRHTEARINLIKALGGGYESKALPATNSTAASTSKNIIPSLVKNTPEAAL
ncbi:MAG: efflux transporter outer membrane subunit [Burkholderiales bacterium]|nr:efflux transporter outer membrane subunit [Burkholderiales bacterium]